MNLTTDEWIPVVNADRQTCRVSLRQVFAEGAEIRDLAVRPHERVALMRLLTCIAQVALDGPHHRAELSQCVKSLPTKADAYLAEWSASFELFHPTQPFLQFAGLEKLTKHSPKAESKKAATEVDDAEESEGTLASKLDFAFATGNNTTLFDHGAASSDARIFTPAHLALMLITFQCFSPGGRIGVARWKGIETPGKGSSGHAPCSPAAMLHSFIRKENLLSTIHANLLTKFAVEMNYRKEWGVPVWEWMPDSFDDEEVIANATETYLGRLMPLSRAILLRQHGKSLLLANGLNYPSFPAFPAEPSAASVVKRDNSGHVLVGAGNRALWRELPALVVKRFDGIGGPLALTEMNDEADVDLWVGALITDKASILDTVEGCYQIPARMLNEVGRKAYGSEVQKSEQVGISLIEAMITYRKLLELNPQSYPEKEVAMRHYWTSVEQLVPLLRRYLSTPDGSDEAQENLQKWRAALWRTGRDAFNAACGTSTPRQQRAGALALRTLQNSVRKQDKSSDQPMPEPISTTFPELSDPAVVEFVSELRRRGDQGTLASLRGALSNSEERQIHAWRVLARFGGIPSESPHKAEVVRTVAGLMTIPELRHTRTGRSFAHTCLSLLSGAERAYLHRPELPGPITRRILHLLAATPAEVCERVCRLGARLGAERRALDFARLYWDLLLWDQRTKARWAAEFWGASPEDEGVTTVTTDSSDQ